MDLFETKVCMTKCKGLFNQEELEDLINIITSEQPAMTKSMFGKSILAEDDKHIWLCHYAGVAENQMYWLKKAESCKFTARKDAILSASELLNVRLNHSTGDSTTVSNQFLSGKMTVFEQNESEGQILLEQHIAFLASYYGQRSYQLVNLINPVTIKGDKQYEIQFDFDSSWTDQKFWVVIPHFDELEDIGVINSLCVCYKN